MTKQTKVSRSKDSASRTASSKTSTEIRKPLKRLMETAVNFAKAHRQLHKPILPWPSGYMGDWPKEAQGAHKAVLAWRTSASDELLRAAIEYERSKRISFAAS